MVRVDFLLLHEVQPAKLAEALRESHHALEVVAVVPNDLNLPTLLNFLSPAETIKKLNGPVKKPGPLPAALQDGKTDTIVLFRIDRAQLRRPGKGQGVPR